MGSAWVSFRPQGVHFRNKRAYLRFERGPSKMKWKNNDELSFLGGDPLNQGALHWIIAPPVTRVLAAPQNLYQMFFMDSIFMLKYFTGTPLFNRYLNTWGIL